MADAVLMRRTIYQFMWGYQPSFRLALDSLAETTLAGIGTAVAPQSFLVGFARTEDARHSVCIEPERGPFAQAELECVSRRALELYEADPLRDMIHTDPGVHEQRQAGLQDKARAQALCEALGASPGGAGRTFFAGVGVPVDDYVVYPVLSVLSARWSALPALATTERHRLTADRSLPLAAVRQVLRAASRELRQQPPPQTIEAESAETIRAAASSLTDSVVQVLLGQFIGSGLKDSLDAVAAQPYEGRAGAGTLLLVGPAHPHVEVVVSFDRPVSVRATRELRKVLEMSAPGLGLLCDGAHVYGMGRLTPGFDPQIEDAFLVTVVGRGSWELAAPINADTGQVVPLLRLDNGQARLPTDRLSKDVFLDSVDRLFPDAPTGSADLLWDLAHACADQAHGTMLVVHPDATDEGHRLHPQALTITPTRPSPEALLAMTSIDGAVLVSPDAHCHAVGVILDGTATGTGDPARGARYNSAVRYLEGHGKGSLIIIVSEDGMINLLPDLRPRRKRDDVEQAVERLVAASTGTPDYEAFYNLSRHIESLEFYLDQAQCDAVNAAHQAVEDHRWNEDGMFVYSKKMKPDPAMNDTHWL
jgi:DisA bacterial checkpoint controller nucleotide-binding